MIALLAAALIATNAPVSEVVAAMRGSVPASLEISGGITVRNRRGVAQSERLYRLVRKDGATELYVDGEKVEEPAAEAARQPLFGSDVTWSDLTLEYLGWKEFSFDEKREGESVHGQVCTVVLMKKGDRTVRVWVDRRTGAMLEAEELEKGEPVRRLWGTRLKKFGDRWSAGTLEVERIGSGHRTRITVKEMK